MHGNNSALQAVKQAAQSMPVVVRTPRAYEQLGNHYRKGYINDYATRYSQPPLQWMVERGGLYFTMIEKVFSDHGIPAEMKYLAVIESGMSYNACSTRWRSRRWWQFMSGTARIFGLSVGKKVDEGKISINPP